MLVFLSSISSSQAGRIDHEAIFHVTLEHAFIGCVDLVGPDQFNVRHDIMLGAEHEK